MMAKMVEQYLPDRTRNTITCVSCGNLNERDDDVYTVCRKCDIATCHNCGGEVSFIYDNTAPDGRVYIWESKCTKCRREF